MLEAKEYWIKTGYEIFAYSGLDGLKVETLARKVGISKSSFYHHFADINIFIDCLLAHHNQQVQIIATEEQKCQSIDPELITVLLNHKTDLLFHRRLRVYRDNRLFNDTLSRSNQLIRDGFMQVWVTDLNLELTQKQLDGLFDLALENFFLQITPETLTADWLTSYFSALKRLAFTFA